MILLTRLNGPVFALNPDLVERADSTPDTVITLVDGTKYVVAESLAELVALIRQYRAGVVADAQHLVDQPEAATAVDGHRADARGAYGAPGAHGTTGAHGTAAGAHGTAGDEAVAQTPQSNVVPLHRRER